jgi:RHS repeat-associated protein
METLEDPVVPANHAARPSISAHPDNCPPKVLHDFGPGAPTANVYNPVSNRNTNSGYDNAGNLSSLGSQSATFDAENRLLTVGSETYFYDGVGQRVGKSGPSASIMYVYDAFGQLASEYNLSTNPAVPPCATCYVAGDHLGSLRLVTDGSQNANVIARHDFAPFGQEITAGVGGRTPVWGATDNVSQRFTGQVRDSEVSVDFFNARYLSSGLGRFISADPANAGMDFTNPQSMNGYGYVLGNPLGLVDPGGMGIGSFFSGLWDTVFGTKPCSVQFCVVTASTAPIGTYAWWMGGGWLTLSGAPTGGGSSSGGGSGVPTFYGTGLYLEPVSTPSNTTLRLPAKSGTQGCDDSTNNRSRFFQYLPGMLDVAKQLNVPSTYIVGLASYESGWLDDHNAKLNNLWGLTQAGGNNISFPSMQAGNQYFATRVGPFIQNSQTIPTFFSGLKKEGYNAVNPNYFSMNPRKGMLFNRISNIQKWAKACNASF